MKNIFIAGESGSVGLKIKKLAQNHPKVKLVSPTESFSNLSENELQKIIHDTSLDLMFLALPDEIAQEMIEIQQAINSTLKVVDCSVLNRTNPRWTYGLPELNPSQKEKIKQAQFVANPGCHATGAILAIKSMLANQIISQKQTVCIHSTTGHSGGGKKEIEKYQQQPELPPIAYSLNKTHKHETEIKQFGGVEQIAFTPLKVNSPIGMLVESTFTQVNQALAEQAVGLIANYYQNSEFVQVAETPTQLLMTENVGTNNISLYVHYDVSNLVIKIHALLDNLIKGSAGAAIQNMNLMLGFAEPEGLK